MTTEETKKTETKKKAAPKKAAKKEINLPDKSKVLDRLKLVVQERRGEGEEVRFYYDGSLSQDLTAKNGRHTYNICERIEARIPGKAEPHVSKVKPRHIAEYGAAYQAFKSQGEAPMDGTLLKEWALLPANIMMELRDLGLVTVEELAVCSGIAELEFYAEWVQAANDWIAAADSAQNVVPGLKKKIEALERELQVKQDQILRMDRELKGK